MDGLSLLPAIAVIPLLSNSLFATMMVADAVAFPFAALVSAAMIYDISQRSQSHAGIYRHIAAGELLLVTIGNLFLFSGLIPILLCVLIGFGLLTLGYRQQQRSIFASGAVLMLTGMLQQVYELVHHFDLGSWISLAILGIAAIVLASTIESQGGRLKPKLEHWKTSFKQWEK